MAWDDPSPRPRPRPTAGGPSSQPGYGDDGVRLSFGTIVARTAVALLVGGIVYACAHSGVLAWQAGRAAAPHPALAIALPLLAAVVVGWLVLRALLKRPPSVGLSDRVRNGGGWFGGRRSWDDGYGGYGYPTIEQQVTADVVGDVVGAVIDIAID